MAPPNWKPLRWESAEYQEFVRRHPCATPGCVTRQDRAAHHEQEKGHGGRATKAHDSRCLPLCTEHHAIRHSVGRGVWQRWGRDPEQTIGELNAEWLALGNNFDESSHKPKPKRRARPAKGRPMARTKPEPEIEVACAVCQHPHGSFVKKNVPKAFVCSSCGIGQKVEKADWVSHTRGRNYPEGAMQ